MSRYAIYHSISPLDFWINSVLRLEQKVIFYRIQLSQYPIITVPIYKTEETSISPSFVISLHNPDSDRGPRPERESLREVDVGGCSVVVEARGKADQVSDLVFVLGSLILKVL